MTDREDKEHIEVDFGVGKVSFSGMFKGIGSLIDLVSKLDQEGIKKSGAIKGLPKDARGVYGFSIRTLSGKPVIETFGNVSEGARGPEVRTVWEPMVDVFDEGERVLVIAELPGAAEDDIQVEVSGDIMNLTASSKNRQYAREILLPARVKPGVMQKVYRNGILEITLEKERGNGG
ncbi:MAG: Hsp20/alpha crystallin family protein [Chloroflexi bacterium]|nr:Hsp20/alpha crystallin family protein [Chloroflexota bacterium]